LNQIKELNKDNKVHGIIVQLPFDSDQNLNVNLIINSVHQSKDVDGLTNENAGKLTNGFLNDCIIPCIEILLSLSFFLVCLM
jgi:5,10-methylene-tetrahydrofolate dehydrogenase/methenyl tetrahydrofolate cyclohydrolase